MKIIDTSGSLQWRMRQRSDITRATGRTSGDQVLQSKLRELHRRVTTTRLPQADGFYREGRAMLQMYKQGFSDIRDFTRMYSSGVQNARMSDEEIDDIIERMNLTPR